MMSMLMLMPDLWNVDVDVVQSDEQMLPGTKKREAPINTSGNNCDGDEGVV